MGSFLKRLLGTVSGFLGITRQRLAGESPLTWRQWEASRSLPEFDSEAERRIMRQVGLGLRENVLLLPFCLPGGHRHSLWASSSDSEESRRDHGEAEAGQRESVARPRREAEPVPVP